MYSHRRPTDPAVLQIVHDRPRSSLRSANSLHWTTNAAIEEPIAAFRSRAPSAGIDLSRGGCYRLAPACSHAVPAFSVNRSGIWIATSNGESADLRISGNAVFRWTHGK